MSKSGKTRRKLKRLAAKRAKKAAMRARYEAFKATGQNSKRAVLKRQRKKTVRNQRHLVACGNVGCKKCFPELNNVRHIS